jgi:hypothetical protein
MATLNNDLKTFAVVTLLLSNQSSLLGTLQALRLLQW